MALTSRLLHRGSLMQITCVCCRPESAGRGEHEQVAIDALVLPLSGVFVRADANGREAVATASQALFFNAGDTHRIAHPAGGDECLGIEPSAALLRELLARFDPARAERGRQPFAMTHAALSAPAAIARGLLLRRLREGDALAIEEQGLALFAAVLGATTAHDAARDDMPPQARSRRREQAQATAITVARQPEQAWSLEALARAVHASPYHLARAFRAEFGETIHQQLLRARLAAALDAVLDSDESLTRLALRLGFATPSHFAEAFRRRFGQAASALRKQAGAAAVREMRKIPTVRREP